MNVRFIDNKDWAQPIESWGYERDCSSFADFVQRCAEGSFVGVRFVLSPPDGALLWMAADAVGSSPVYFHKKSDEWVVGSTGFDTLERDEEARYDEEALLFYRRWGITPREKTLYQEVKRLPPGSAVRINREGEYELRYWDEVGFPLQAKDLPPDYKQGKVALHSLFDQMTQRIVDRAAGRQIVLPLTGGRDSRLIASGLKRFGVENVLCLTYGRETNNADLDVARTIAARLGYPHRFINSVPTDLPPLSYTNDDDFLRFARYLGGLGSCYFYQEYQPALRLSGEGLLGSDSLILTGHNGDIVGGGLLIYPQMNRPMPDSRLLLLAMLHGHRHTRLNKDERRRLLGIHRLSFEDIAAKDSWSRFELFMRREFAAKYYSNSGRSWRYFGGDVMHPFVDADLIRFAHSLPFSWRYGKHIYDDLTDEIFREMGISLDRDTRQRDKQQGLLYQLKMLARPYCSSYLFNKRDDAPENIGFDRLMDPLRREIERDGTYHPTSYNGLSFAWYISQLPRLRSL